MSARPVSLLVWRDAKSDPPKGPLRFVIVESASGEVSPIWFRDHVWDYPNVVRWAELPVLSDLTDEDVRNIAVWALDGERLTTDGSHDTVDRLRAALGGEKEEA